MVIDSQIQARPGLESLSARRSRSRRNPKWIALGVIAICLGAIASFVLYSQAAESHQVVVVRRSLHRGATITGSDLGSVTIGNTGGVDTVAAGAIPGLVGQVAATDLIRGSLLPPGATTRELPPSHGRAIIGVRVATGRAPVGFLAPGSPVRLVVLPVDAGKADLGAAGGGAAATGPQELTNVATISAVVISSTALDDGTFIDVALDSGQAVDAASYAAQDRLVVVRESER